MGMSDSQSTETKIQDEVLRLILDHKKSIEARYRSDAIRDLVKLGVDKKNNDTDVPPKYIQHFDTKEGRVGFSVTKAMASHVKAYAATHEIEYQQAYFEYICCGLEKANGKKPLA